MRMRNRRKRKFYVVQFIESPFEGIDDYVCVPYFWLIFQKPVYVTYPNNEDPLFTRERVKRNEKPDDNWRFYTACIKYETDDYTNAEKWITKRNDYGQGENESEIEDTQPEPSYGKFRSTSQSVWSDSNQDNPQLTVKPYENPRKPLKRMLIRRQLSSCSDRNLDNKRLKLNVNAKPGSVTSAISSNSSKAIIESVCSMQERRIIITDNQLIQNDQTKTNFPSNGGTNTEQSTQVGSINEYQSVGMSAQSSSTKILTERLKLLDDQLSAQSPTDGKPSSKFTVEQQLLSVDLAYQQPLKMPVIHLDKSNEDINSRQNVPSEPVTEEKLSTNTLTDTLEQTPQPEPISEKTTLLACHEYSLPEPHPQDVSIQQSNEPNGGQNSHYIPKLTMLSQLLSSSVKNQIPVVKNLKNPVAQKARLEGITKLMTTTQYPPNSMMQFSSPNTVIQTEPLSQNPLQQARVNSSLVNNVRCSIGKECMDQRDPFSEGIMKTSAAQNLSKLAHQYSSFVGASGEQQYLSTQEAYLQQFARTQNMLGRQTMAQTIDPSVYHQNAMKNEFVMQSQPNPIIQPIQFFSQTENKNIPVDSAYAQEVMRYDLMRVPFDRAHTTYKPNVNNGVNIQLAAHNSSNQLYQNSERRQQKQDPRNYQISYKASTHNGFPLQSNRSSHILRPQRVTENPRSPSLLKTPSQVFSDAQKSCLLQELGLQRVSQNSTQNRNINLATLCGNIPVESIPTTQDFGNQTMPSYDRSHEIQSILAQSNHVYQHLHTKKTMVDQATETDLIMDVDHCVDEIAGSPVGKCSSKIMDSECQTDELLEEEQGSPYQETVLDSGNATEHEIESDNETDSDANQTNLTTMQNLTPENQKTQSRIEAEQDMLDVCGALFTQMGANLSLTCDMFNSLRNSILVCAKTYETLLEKVDKLNSIENLQISTSLPNDVPSQVTQKRPAGDNDNNTGVGAVPTPTREQKVTFSLPPEYDPNDTKWTLKYRNKKPGVVELSPRTGIYVNRKELKRCIRESNDCRSLARLLLTEIFSKNALSVCSLTGGKAKAFGSVKIDIRPGLDEHAKMVLLAFVEEHGKKHGWNPFDLSAVNSSIRIKINAIRAKHGKTYKV